MTAKKIKRNDGIYLPMGIPDDAAFYIQLAKAKAEVEAAEKNRFHPLSYQRMPEHHPGKVLFSCGRAVGKTNGANNIIMDHLEAYGESAFVGYMAPTIPTVRDTNMYGKSGLLTLYGQRENGWPGKYGNHFPHINQTNRFAYHEKGGKVMFFGAEAIESLNGPEFTLLVIDEAWAISRMAYDTAIFMVRGIPAPGVRPTVVITTTPKDSPLVADLIDHSANIAGTAASRGEVPNTCYTRFVETKENIHLDPSVVADWYRDYAGTDLECSELKGRPRKASPDSYWQLDWINAHRSDAEAIRSSLKNTIVVVDPNKESVKGQSHAGIAVIGEDRFGMFHVLEAVHGRWRPDEWASRAISFFQLWNAKYILVEDNVGGELIDNAFANINRNIPIHRLQSCTSKPSRAWPVSIVYQQGRVFHARVFDELETKMCLFPTNEKTAIIDDLDAVVMGIRDLAGMSGRTAICESQSVEEVERECRGLKDENGKPYFQDDYDDNVITMREAMGG